MKNMILLMVFLLLSSDLLQVLFELLMLTNNLATTFTFELSKSFSMRREEQGAMGNIGYSWADSSGKGFLFELEEETTDTMKSLFETTVCKSAWEAAQKMTFPEDGDLEELTERHLRSIAPPSVPSSTIETTTAITSVTEKEQPASHWAGAPPSPIRTTEIRIGLCVCCVRFFFF